MKAFFTYFKTSRRAEGPYRSKVDVLMDCLRSFWAEHMSLVTFERLCRLKGIVLHYCMTLHHFRDDCTLSFLWWSGVVQPKMSYFIHFSSRVNISFGRGLNMFSSFRQGRSIFFWEWDRTESHQEGARVDESECLYVLLLYLWSECGFSLCLNQTMLFFYREIWNDFVSEMWLVYCISRPLAF